MLFEVTTTCDLKYFQVYDSIDTDDVFGLELVELFYNIKMKILSFTFGWNIIYIKMVIIFTVY